MRWSAIFGIVAMPLPMHILELSGGSQWINDWQQMMDRHSDVVFDNHDDRPVWNLICASEASKQMIIQHG
jgi:hypothetical protein